jgi:hypothetical protein
MPPTNQDLAATVSAYIRAWRRMSRAYASMSIVLRGTLIIASAIVAAKLGLKDVFRDVTFSVLSVVVAAGTALEAWLKPREKWKGFMTDRDNAEDLFMRLENTDPTDSKRIDELRQQFQGILATHREKNVF